MGDKAEIKASWWDLHKPTKRRIIQLYSALLYNAKRYLQIFIAQTLAVSDGMDLFVSDDELDEEKKLVLNNVIRECIKEGAKE